MIGYDVSAEWGETLRRLLVADSGIAVTKVPYASVQASSKEVSHYPRVI